MPRKKQAKLPTFKNEDAERAFWSENDSADYIDWSQAQPTTAPNLRPTLKSISLRIPESLLERIKQLASKKDVPYQSLMKIYLSERVDEELHHHHH
jgi:predicted DNA binding CopG/RHH family protein